MKELKRDFTSGMSLTCSGTLVMPPALSGFPGNWKLRISLPLAERERKRDDSQTDRQTGKEKGRTKTELRGISHIVWGHLWPNTNCGP